MNRRPHNTNAVTETTQIVNVGGATGAVSGITSTMAFGSYYTIEEHLYEISRDPRFSYLWSNWVVEKHEHIRQLESAQHNTYADYSLHDKNHSAKIITNIERMLGPGRIAALTPGDTWLILQSAYTHDLGMNVSDKEKRLFCLSPKSDEIIKSKEFRDEFTKAVKKMRSNNTGEHYSSAYTHFTLRRAADYWNDHLEELFDDSAVFRDAVFGRDFTMAAFFYHIITQSHFRNLHAKRSRDMLRQKHQENVMRDVIPRNMRNALSEIVFCHIDKPDVVIKNLEYKQNGFCSGDYIHPRFVAALLRLGDLLDAESTRFNPHTIDNLENISEGNLAYMIKDLSVSEILIDTSVINVTASFETEMVKSFLLSQKFAEAEDDLGRRVRELIASAIKHMQSWMVYIKSNTTEFWWSWKDIAPENMIGGLPSPHKLKILYNGQEVAENDLDLRYRIDPNRAAEIIEGSSLYEESLVFLREIIQNAIDATILEVYRVILKGSAGKGEENISLPDFFNKYAYAFKERKVKLKIDHDKEKHILTFAIIDEGIGITKAKLNNMRQVGAVKELAWEKEIEKMPEWMRPTADFGIGMQSAFLVADKFVLHSRPKDEGSKEKPLQHRIIFNSMKLGGDITSIEKEVVDPDNRAELNPWDEKAGTNYPYGTRFLIEINLNKKNAFTKRFGAGSVDAAGLPMFAQNLYAKVKRKCINFLWEQFIQALIPIETEIDGQREDSCCFDITPFAYARPYDKKSDNFRITVDKDRRTNIYFWHTHVWGEKEKMKPFNAMFVFRPVQPLAAAKTKLFYRGIRFGFSGSHKDLRLDNLVGNLGFDCDINIMSGCAHDFLEINREGIKEDMHGWLCRAIASGLSEFYDQTISLLGKLSKQDDALSDKEKEMKSSLREMLQSSPQFISQLQIYSMVKKSANSETRAFLSDIYGGMRDIALFDKRAGRIVFMPEPVIDAGAIPPEMLIDAQDSAFGSVFDLIKSDLQPHLEETEKDEAEKNKTEKLLCNIAPKLLGLRFTELRAYPCVDGRVVKIYKLSDKLDADAKQTEMDFFSYRAVISDMVREYKERLAAGKMDGDYLPVLPAPPGDIEEIPYEIATLTFPDMPNSDDDICDKRFVRFIISPYTIKMLADCLDGNMELDFETLMKGEHKALCSHSIAYMRNVCNKEGKLGSDTKNADDKIIEIWGEFATVICQALKL